MKMRMCLIGVVVGYTFGGPSEGVVINTQEEFEAAFVLPPQLAERPKCQDSVLPEVDFDTKTLLGLSTHGGCNTKTITSVYREGEVVVFELKVKNWGICERLTIINKLITIPKTTGPVEFRTG